MTILFKLEADKSASARARAQQELSHLRTALDAIHRAEAIATVPLNWEREKREALFAHEKGIENIYYLQALTVIADVRGFRHSTLTSIQRTIQSWSDDINSKIAACDAELRKAREQCESVVQESGERLASQQTDAARIASNPPIPEREKQSGCLGMIAAFFGIWMISGGLDAWSKASQFPTMPTWLYVLCSLWLMVAAALCFPLAADIYHVIAYPIRVENRKTEADEKAKAHIESARRSHSDLIRNAKRELSETEALLTPKIHELTEEVARAEQSMKIVLSC